MNKGILAGLLLALMGNVSAESLFEPYAPVLGIDYKWTRAKLKPGWNHLFAESFPGISLYAAMKLTDNLGLELGYDMTARKSKNRGFVSGDEIGGALVPANVGRFYGFHSSLQFAGSHADVVGYLSVDSNLEVFLSLGLGRVKPRVFVQSLTGSRTAFDEAVTSLRGQHQRVTRVGIGANWAITDQVGFRAKVLWEGFSAIPLKDNVSVGVTPLPDLKPWARAYSLALGLFMKL